MNHHFGENSSKQNFVRLTGLYNIDGEYYLRFDQLKISMAEGMIQLGFMAEGETIITKEYPIMTVGLGGNDTMVISDLYAFTKLHLS